MTRTSLSTKNLSLRFYTSNPIFAIHHVQLLQNITLLECQHPALPVPMIFVQFCNEGSTNFRSSAVEDHARSETHLRAVRATQQTNVSNLIKGKDEKVRGRVFIVWW